MPYEQQIRYYVHKENLKLYMVTDNRNIKMWYKSLLQWDRCATSVKDLLDGYYNGVYTLVNESNVKAFK